MFSGNSPALFCAFLGINILVAIWRIYATLRGQYWEAHRLDEPGPDNWFDPSYVGDNYPMHLPLPPSEPVAMGLHETMRFGLNASEAIGDADWATVLRLSDGYGRARIGPERRVFVVSYFHQLHCLRGIQRGIVFPEATDDVSPAPEHIHHCINYLRQTLLCTAADMLEKGDFMTSSFSSGTIGDTLVCQDWEVLIGAMQRNYDEFMDWTTRWN